MAVFNLLNSYFLFRTKKVDSNILYLLIGITLSFISLTAPIQLHGHYITLFWASETVLLYWLYQKSQIPIIRLASLLVWGAMLVSLLMDWMDAYGTFFAGRGGSFPLPVIFNKGFMTGFYAALCSIVLFFLRKRIERLASLFLVTGGMLLFVAGFLETNYQFSGRFPESDLSVLYLLLYTYSFVFLFAFICERLKWTSSSWYTAGPLAACIVIYLVFIPETSGIQRDMLEQHHYFSHFFAHWSGALLIVVILYRLIAWQRSEKIQMDPAFFTWVAGGLVVIFLSVEGQLLTNTLFFSKGYSLEELQRVYVKTGLPILWGICSFAFMWLGMRNKFKTLRILSLFLFTLTLLKLFLFDIRNIPVAGKIAAFFSLGVLLLVVSFMYQRLKKIIIEDEERKII